MKQLHQHHQLNNFLCQITNQPCHGVSPADSPLYIDAILESATLLLSKLQRLSQTPGVEQEIRCLTDYIQDLQLMSKGATLRSALLNISDDDRGKQQSIKRYTQDLLSQLQQKLRHPNSFFCFRSGWRINSAGHSTSIILKRGSNEHVTLTIGDRGAGRDLTPSPLTAYRFPVSQIHTPEFQQCIEALCSSVFVNSLERISARTASQVLHSLPLQHRIKGIEEVVTGALYPLQQHRNCVINALLLSTRSCLGEKLGQEMELCLIESAQRLIQRERHLIPAVIVEQLQKRQHVLLTPEDADTIPVAPPCYSGGGGEEKPSRDRDNLNSRDQNNNNSLTLIYNKWTDIPRNLNHKPLKDNPYNNNQQLLQKLKTNNLNEKLEFLLKLVSGKKEENGSNLKKLPHKKTHNNQPDTKSINIIGIKNNKKLSPTTPKNEVNTTNLDQALKKILTILLQQSLNGDNQKNKNTLKQDNNINNSKALNQSFKDTNALFQTIKPNPHTATESKATLNTMTFKQA